MVDGKTEYHPNKFKLLLKSKAGRVEPELPGGEPPGAERAGPLQPRAVHAGPSVPQGHEVCGGSQVWWGPQERGQVRAQVHLQPRHGRPPGLVLNCGAENGFQAFQGLRFENLLSGQWIALGQVLNNQNCNTCRNTVSGNPKICIS